MRTEITLDPVDQDWIHSVEVLIKQLSKRLGEWPEDYAKSKGGGVMTPAEGIEYLQKIQERDPDMPVFVLIGPDSFAPATVQGWASMCLAQRSFDKQKHEALAPTRAKGECAMELVREMQAYQREHGSKKPD